MLMLAHCGTHYTFMGERTSQQMQRICCPHTDRPQGGRTDERGRQNAEVSLENTHSCRICPPIWAKDGDPEGFSGEKLLHFLFKFLLTEGIFLS